MTRRAVTRKGLSALVIGGLVTGGLVTGSLVAGTAPAQATTHATPVVTSGSLGSAATSRTEAVASTVLDAAPDGTVASRASIAPRSAARPDVIRLSPDGVGLSLPREAKVGTPQVSDSGLVVYPGKRTSDVSVAVAATSGDHARTTAIHTVIPGPSSPRRYSYEVQRARPVLRKDGTVDLMTAGGAGTARLLLGRVAAPWAVDAKGAHVPTRYVVKGRTLVQVVDVDRDTAFPVVADPSVKMCDWFTAYCVKFGKTDTKRIATAMGSTVQAGISALCGAIPGAGPAILLKAGCAMVVVKTYSSVRSTFVSAKKRGRCVEMKFAALSPTPTVRGYKVVSC